MFKIQDPQDLAQNFVDRIQDPTQNFVDKIQYPQDPMDNFVVRINRKTLWARSRIHRIL